MKQKINKKQKDLLIEILFNELHKQPYKSNSVFEKEYFAKGRHIKKIIKFAESLECE